MDLGKALRMAQASARLTQGELARKSGLTRTTLWQIQEKKISPRVSTLEAITSACGIPLSRMLSWGEDP